MWESCERADRRDPLELRQKARLLLYQSLQHQDARLAVRHVFSYSSSPLGLLRCRLDARGANQSKLPIEIVASHGVITYLYATSDPRFTVGLQTSSTNVGAGCSCHSTGHNIIPLSPFLTILSDPVSCTLSRRNQLRRVIGENALVENRRGFGVLRIRKLDISQSTVASTAIRAVNHVVPPDFLKIPVPGEQRPSSKTKPVDAARVLKSPISAQPRSRRTRTAIAEPSRVAAGAADLHDARP
jgi:hypothetical protein